MVQVGSQVRADSIGKHCTEYTLLCEMVLTSCKWVHKRRVRGGCISCLLFRLANLGVTFGKLQTDRLGHVGVEPDALLQKNWPWKQKEKGRKREKNRYLIKTQENEVQKYFTSAYKNFSSSSKICSIFSFFSGVGVLETN